MKQVLVVIVSGLLLTGCLTGNDEHTELGDHDRPKGAGVFSGSDGKFDVIGRQKKKR